MDHLNHGGTPEQEAAGDAREAAYIRDSRAMEAATELEIRKTEAAEPLTPLCPECESALVIDLGDDDYSCSGCGHVWEG